MFGKKVPWDKLTAPKTLVRVGLVAAPLFGFGALSYFQYYKKTAPDISYSDLLHDADKGEIAKIVGQTDKQSFDVTYQGGKQTRVTIPYGEQPWQRLIDKGITVSMDPKNEASYWFLQLLPFVPLLFLAGFQYFTMSGRMMSGGVGRKLDPANNKTRFTDVAGIDEAKAALVELVDMLKNAERYRRVGARPYKGILLKGPSGTGKTLVAKALAGECGVPFFTTTAADFSSQFISIGGSKIARIFKQAKKNAPCVIFIDELDAIGRRDARGGDGSSTDKEKDAIINKLLTEMDGMDSSDDIIVIAATNRPDAVDPALLRPGRFDRHIVVPKPDKKGREEILRRYLRDKDVDASVNVSEVAAYTAGFSGAELENLINESALVVARRKADVITAADIDVARDRLAMGEARNTNIMTEGEKHRIAVHEAGHAIAVHELQVNGVLHKATIIPHGQSLGSTVSLPNEDRNIYSKKEIKSILAIIMAGHAAETVIFGEEDASSGAADDFKRATQLAKSFVADYGLSTLGPMTIDLSDSANYAMATKVYSAVNKVLVEAKQCAVTLLESRRGALDAISERLKRDETLSGDQIRQIIAQSPKPQI